MAGRRHLVFQFAAAAVVLAACIRPIAPAAPSLAPLPEAVAISPDGTYTPEIDPSRFTSVVDNPWFTLTPGTTMVFEGDTADGFEHIETRVTTETRTIMGVETVVVEDTVWIDDQMVEQTLDWYAQDVDGNVWYFGEASQDFENGQPSSTAGSWEAGVDGAQPGIFMLAAPSVGDAYRQEFYVGEAEDMAEVLEVDGALSIGLGDYDGVLLTREWTPLEPGWEEQKAYAHGTGLIQIVVTQGGTGQVERVDSSGPP